MKKFFEDMFGITQRREQEHEQAQRRAKAELLNIARDVGRHAVVQDNHDKFHVQLFVWNGGARWEFISDYEYVCGMVNARYYSTYAAAKAWGEELSAKFSEMIDREFQRQTEFRNEFMPPDYEKQSLNHDKTNGEVFIQVVQSVSKRWFR